jgi:hypothetical protein
VTKSSSSLTASDPFAPRPTRWAELKQTVGIVAEIACCLDRDGIDVYFLNRGSVKHVTSQEQVINAFAANPEGGTPLARTLQQVLNDKAAIIPEKKLLIVIATDGFATTTT